MMKAYFLRVSAWLSQGVNCVLLGGHHDQTVSARAYIQRYQPGWHVVYRTINALFFWQDDHCRRSHAADVEFAEHIARMET